LSAPFLQSSQSNKRGMERQPQSGNLGLRWKGIADVSSGVKPLPTAFSNHGTCETQWGMKISHRQRRWLL
ncbi:MAG TPA: hypothetical protein VHI52_05225, partial [Verrucomicrobiae bacterium]|nr:hypothetical protein [Verrucomicrobiae bacterium]